ncbi:MAG TPA: prepilin-type N-terminal cleavage/methylation domain-containing protein [Rudaea sp.]|nr:prepilin-type N-terminal cleavage/methylation domain-containing protein [Rudaea sp.]
MSAENAGFSQSASHPLPSPARGRGRVIVALRATPVLNKSGGFTLIELVAAFVIFALGFGVLLQILGGALHTTSQSVDYSKAAMWAQTLLDTQGIGEPLQEGTSSGRFDEQFGWELRVSKYDPPPAQTTVAPIGSADANGLITQVAPSLDLFQLELVVSWGNRFLMHRAQFATVRVMNPPQVAGNGAPPQPQQQPVRGQR